MALLSLSPLSVFTFTGLQPTRLFRRGRSPPPTVRRCKLAAAKPSSQTGVIVRRTANYQPSIWDHDYIQPLTSDFVEETYAKELEKLKGDVKMMLAQVEKPLHQLELVDTLQRLGIYYHFGEEIKRILHSIYENNHRNDKWKNGDLYTTALEFRLLRQHGYQVPLDAINIFMTKRGAKPWIYEDVKGILCLYEASYFSIQGENILEEARDFSRNFLEKYLEGTVAQNDITMMINRAMELPVHRRMLRLEVRWFIDVYEKSQGMNSILLELAKLDYNMVQATYQEDLKHVSMWWRNTGIAEKLSFARDRLVENFLWAVGVIFEPQFGYCRRMLTKVNSLITIIDDVYDVYGTLDELELFTVAVDRWDVDAMEQLPEYMKICFLALYNSINEMAYDVLKEQGFLIISYLRKAWADLCKSYLLERKWYHQGYKPSLQEYIDNAWISISAPVVLVHIYFFITNPIRKEALGSLERYNSIIRWSSMIMRLANDLGTSSDELKRGDVPKSIQCYMYETGASEDDARKYIAFLIDETWKKMNEDGNNIENCPFSRTFIGIATNLARTAQCMYQYGDGYGVQDRETKDRVITLLIQPISLTNKTPAFQSEM